MFSLYNSAGVYVFRELRATEECWEWEGWPSLGKSSPIGCSGPKGFLILKLFFLGGVIGHLPTFQTLKCLCWF